MSKRMGLLSNAQSKIMKMNYYKLLNCRILLYFILLIALCDLFYFAMEKDFLFCGIFILIGFLTSFFSKNMMVILVIAITFTNILRFGKSTTVNEGMEDNQGDFENGDDENGKKSDNLDVDDNLDITTTSSDKKKVDDKSNSKISTDDLDSQTVNLIEQQKTLMKNMENLGPLLENAETFMEKFKTINN